MSYLYSFGSIDYNQIATTVYKQSLLSLEWTAVVPSVETEPTGTRFWRILNLFLSDA